MSVDLAVWHSDKAMSVEQASQFYLKVCKRQLTPTEKHPSVELFYEDLCQVFPEIDTLSEDEQYDSPWSCAHDRSGLHLVACMNLGDRMEEAARLVVKLASTHGLTCYNPQSRSVYVPAHLKSERATCSTMTTDFQTAVADFTAFAAKQGYPSTLLWTTPEDVRFWRGRYYVRHYNVEEHESRAEEAFETRSFGVAIDGLGKTDHFTICRVLVPDDDLDAEYRMIPKTGVKMSVADDPPPVVLMRSAVLWWLLARIGSRSMAA